MATTKISAVIGIGAELTSGFRQTFGGLNTALAGTSGRVRALNTAAGQVEGYRKLQTALPQSAEKVAQAEAKLEKLRAELKATGGTSDELKNKVGEQEARVNQLKTAYDKQETSLRNTKEALKAAGVDTSNLVAEEKRLAAEAERATAKLKAQAGVKVAIGNLKTSFGALRTSAMQAGIAITAAGYGLQKLVGGTADAGDEAAKTAATLNMSAKALQQWQFIGARAGVSSDLMVKGFEKLNEQLEDAVMNGGKSREIFGELNLDPESLRLASATQRMQMIGQALQGYNGRMSKAAIVQQLFGKNALRMQGVLGMTAEAQAELAREAERAGFAMSDAQAKAAEGYKDSMASLTIAIQGVRNQFGFALMPTITKGINWLTRNTWALKAAFVAVAVVIGTACVVSVAKLGLSAISTFKQVRNLVVAMRVLGATESAGGKAGIFARMLGGAKSVLPWLLRIGGVIIPMIVGAATTGAAAIGTAIAAIPIVGWIAAAVTLIAILIWKYWTPIKKFFSSLGQTIGYAFTWGFGIAKKVVSSYIAFYMRFVGVLASVGKRMLDIILAPFRAVRAAIKWIGDKLGLTSTETGKAVTTQSVAQMHGRRPASASLPSRAMPSVSPAAAQGRRGATVSSTQNNAITINTQPGQSPEQVADAVSRRLDARGRERARVSMTDYTPAYAGGAA